MKRFLIPGALALAAIATPALAQAPSATVDPARSAAARVTVDSVFPAGTYRKLMGGNLTKMLSGMSDRMLDMPVKTMVAMGGASPEELKPLSDATMRQVMEIIDPAFAERNKRMFAHMMTGMADIMDGFEPEIRGALADAYAARFTLAQLQELNHFFATPTGHLYAENAMTLAMDPAFIDRMTKLTPRLMEAMPGIVKTALADTRDLPARRSYATLSEAERARLMQLLGVPADETAKVIATLEKQQKRQETGHP